MARYASAIAVVIAAVSTPALGAGTSVPLQSDICKDGFVDKRKLANFLLDAYQVRRDFVDTMVAKFRGDPRYTDVRYARIPDSEAIFVYQNPCAPENACSKDDKHALEKATIGYTTLLSGYPLTYERVNGSDNDPAAFILDDEEQVRCLSNNGQVIEAAGSAKPPYKYTLPLVVRGGTDSLFYTRDQAQFLSATKATVSFNRDSVANKTAEQITGVVGYSIPFGLNQVIPYVGINKNYSKVTGQASSATADTVELGVDGAFNLEAAWGAGENQTIMDNYLTFRPSFLFDDSDNSGIAGFSFTWAPVINDLLNDFIRLDRNRDEFASIEPIAELHIDNGWYTDRGTLNPAGHVDFSRIGPKYGVSLTSDDPNIPLTLSVYDTHLFKMRGAVDVLDYFYSDLSWALDPKKYFSFDVTYKNGLREDTGKPEQIFGAALSAKY